MIKYVLLVSLEKIMSGVQRTAPRECQREVARVEKFWGMFKVVTTFQPYKGAPGRGSSAGCHSSFTPAISAI